MKRIRFPWPRRYRAAYAVVLGIPVGVALFTFAYAEGLSYFSSNPRACANCHIMQDEYDSWAKSGHRHVARCNDCHLPRALLPKFVAKARNGWNHSSAFTLENFHEPIQIGTRNAGSPWAWIAKRSIGDPTRLKSRWGSAATPKTGRDAFRGW